MSDEIREIYKDEVNNEAEDEEVLEEETPEDETFEAVEDDSPQVSAAVDKRMQRRRKRVRGRKRRRKVLSVIFIIAVFAMLFTMCGRDILRLKAENLALQKQQKELEEERDKLQKEVENAGNREYVQDQARKQLRLLNPGELLFTFDEEEEKE